MKKALSFFLVLIIAQALTAQDWIPFTDSSASFTASYPSTWTKKMKEGGIVVFSTPLSGAQDLFQENINVIVRQHPAFTPSFDIKEAMPSIIERLTSTLQEFHETGERYFTWNNKPAAELKFTIVNKSEGPAGLQQIKMMQWYCAGEGVFYTATYTSLRNDDTYDNDALKLFQSIRFR